MADQELHPQVVQFREFLQRRPGLVRAARESGRGYQEFFENWVLLGENDPYWKKFEEGEETKDTEKKAEKSLPFLDTVMNLAKKTDPAEIRKHAESFGETIRSLQEMVALFQKNEKNTVKNQSGNSELFHVFRD
ncbi:spore coat protein YlbD [Aciduricibacillus chroicocephali]|uniref:Spore coat protein YlbD n=1 Tax=Aciduricibacillus chroicocephali TaxID=3054939 RepID=A0ABY9KY55_9BACI|nr:spore coat protein YlbD [Bacillaceae bacterium 44XB]